MAPLCNCSLLFLCALSLHIQHHIMDNLQFAGAECARGLVAWWSGLPNASEKVPPCHCTQTIYYWMHSIHTHLEHVQCSAKGYLTLRCARKYDEWWGLSDCVLKDISHWDELGKMMSKELLADLDANTWSLSLSRWAKWGENSMAVASAIETILILSWVCGRNHAVGLS
jgi:hypothetical protein